jgi:hypothetical protein
MAAAAAAVGTRAEGFPPMPLLKHVRLHVRFSAAARPPQGRRKTANKSNALVIQSVSMVVWIWRVAQIVQIIGTIQTLVRTHLLQQLVLQVARVELEDLPIIATQWLDNHRLCGRHPRQRPQLHRRATPQAEAVCERGGDAEGAL